VVSIGTLIEVGMVHARVLGSGSQENRSQTFKKDRTKADLPSVNPIGAFDSTLRVAATDTAKDSVRDRAGIVSKIRTPGPCGAGSRWGSGQEEEVVGWPRCVARRGRAPSGHS
jgi:hypothetical protein